MAYTSEITKEKQAGVTPSGKQVVRQRVQVSTSVGMANTLRQLITYAIAIVEVLLFFRFILKLLGANPVSGFVNFIYTLSSIFEAPFRGIFPTEVQPGLVAKSVLEPSSVVAIFVYAVIAIGLEELIRIFSQHSWEE